MENLSIYLPSDRRQALAKGKTLSNRAKGTALFADLSGFTNLTEALSLVHGPKRGAEEITSHLNQIYDALIIPVERFRGSVIGFSGDAMTCWFDKDDGLRALAVAFEIQKAMGKFANIAVPQQGNVTLSVKVAVASGTIRRFLVGNPSIRYLDVIAGATVDRLSAGEKHARKGEILADESTINSLEGSIRLGEWRGEDRERFAVVDWLDPDAVPKVRKSRKSIDLSDEQVRPWLIPAVYERLHHGQEGFISELRSAVPVFIKFSGIDYEGDKSAGVKLDAFVRWVQGVFAKYDGTFFELTLGDKGSYIYGAFGAPTAHDDDALRAVASAEELRTPPSELDFIKDIQIGVSRGRMRAGPYGGTTRRSYSVIGDETNVAARLMENAEAGQVIVSKNIFQSVEHRYQFSPLGTIAVRGKTDPITVFRLLGIRSNAKGEGSIGPAVRKKESIVGRSTERTELDGQVRQLIDERRGGITLIEGEAGIGKSRLVLEVIERAQSAGVTCVSGAGDAIEQAALYHAWKPVFLQLLGLNLLADDGDARREHLLSHLAAAGDDLERYAPLFSAIAPLDIPDNETTSILSGQVRAESTRGFLAKLVARHAQNAPLMIVIEDAHWLDSSSWALAQRVATLSESLILVMVTRPLGEHPSQEYQQISAMPNAKRIELGMLEADDTIELVKLRLGVSELPVSVMNLIREKAEGNPFYSEELAYSLRDANLIVIRGGVCELAPGTDLHQISFPARVEDIITSRIDLLSPPHQLALKVASVIGRIFTYQTLRDIHPVPEDIPHLMEYLDMLSKVDLTPIESPEPDLAYMFKHIITQEVAYNLMLFKQRRRLHQAIAEWFEGRHADDLSNHYSTLAYHWNKVAEGQDADPAIISKAVDYLFKAANQASQNYANAEAAAHFKNALTLLHRLPASPERDQQELGMQTMLAFSLVTQRGYGDPEVEAAYRRAGELSAAVNETAQLGFILYGIFSFHSSRGEYKQGDELADRILALGESMNDQPLLAIGYQSKSIVAFCRGELKNAMTYAQKSYDIADPLDNSAFFAVGGDFQAYTSAWLALSQLLSGYPDQARKTFEHALSATEHQPYPHCFILGFAFLPQLMRDIPAALTRTEELVSLSQKYSFVLLGLQGNIFRAWTMAVAQKDPMGVQILEGTTPVPKFVKLDSFVPWYLALLAEGRSAVGEHESALQAVDEALGYVESAGGNFYQAELHRLKGDILRAQGADSETAAQQYMEAVRRARSQNAKWWELRASTSLARLLQSQGKHEEARTTLEPVFDWFTEGFDAPDLAQAKSLLAELQQS